MESDVDLAITGHRYWTDQYFWNPFNILFLFTQVLSVELSLPQKLRERTLDIFNYRFDLQSSCLLAPIPQNVHLTLSTCVVPLIIRTSINEFLERGCSPQHLAELTLCLLLLTYSWTKTRCVFPRNQNVLYVLWTIPNKSEKTDCQSQAVTSNDTGKTPKNWNFLKCKV